MYTIEDVSEIAKSISDFANTNSDFPPSPDRTFTVARVKGVDTVTSGDYNKNLFIGLMFARNCTTNYLLGFTIDNTSIVFVDNGSYLADGWLITYSEPIMGQ